MNDKTKILLISYADLEYDGRLRELREVFSELGNVTCFSRNTRSDMQGCIRYEGGYLGFILASYQFAMRYKADWLVLDNRKSTIPGLIIRNIARPKVTIQDSRELYLPDETKRVSGRIGCYFEVRSARKADIVICASQERAELMEHKLNLRETPLVFENLRELKYESEDARQEAKVKIDPLLNDGEYRVVSTAGCDMSRLTSDLIESVTRVKHAVHLYLVGGGKDEDIALARQLIDRNDISHKVTILDRLNQNELKYLIGCSHIGIVSYHQRDTNNRLCASGKVYEFIYEGVPVVTTSNPPLKRICAKYSIGIVDDGFAMGIDTLIRDYTKYKDMITEFISHHKVSNNNSKLAAAINERIKSLQ